MGRFVFGLVVVWMTCSTAFAATDPCHLTQGLRPAHCPKDDKIALLPAQIRQDHVFFRRGGAQLSPDAQAQLSHLATVLSNERFSGTCVRLVGHADSVGGASANDALALRRAEAVQSFLEPKLPPGLIGFETASQGENDPLTLFPSEDPLQRRVAIWARKCSV